MDIKLLKQLRSKLENRDLKKVAKMAGVSYSTVFNWLGGRATPKKTDEIIEAIKTVTAEKASKQAEQEEKVKELITNL